MVKPRRPGLGQTLASVLAAGFGVQSDRNRRRDFSGGSPVRFVLVGLLATVVFIGLVVLAVRVILALATG